MYPQPKEIKSITSIGGGPIGGGWSAHFLAKGYNVKSYLHDHKEESEFWNILKTAWRSLRELGLSPGASLNNLSIVYSIEEAVKETEFIQESAPEILSLKQELYKFLGEVVPRNIVIGSSTSGLTMTDIQLHCSTAARTVIAHPFNPPYLLPLVEIVGGEKTSKDTVDWAPNFDETLKEPAVLPSSVPTLLINGSEGIAVGMATKIPPHNLVELVNGIIALIDKQDITTDELMEHIKGPDFPTAGLILGIDGLKEAYETGRGKIKMRARAHIETNKNGKDSIVITEVAYQTNKANLVEKIADLVRDKKVEPSVSG